MITGFHHTGIVVRDLERMVRFYTETLGLQELNRVESVAPPEGDHTGVPGARRTLVFVGLPEDHQVELVYYHQPESPDGYLDKHQLGATHVCFRVDDLKQTYEALAKKGVRFVTEPKYHDVNSTTVGIVYGQDPEGNWLEWIEGF